MLTRNCLPQTLVKPQISRKSVVSHLLALFMLFSFRNVQLLFFPLDDSSVYSFWFIIGHIQKLSLKPQISLPSFFYLIPSALLWNVLTVWLCCTPHWEAQGQGLCLFSLYTQILALHRHSGICLTKHIYITTSWGVVGLTEMAIPSFWLPL